MTPFYEAIQRGQERGQERGQLPAGSKPSEIVAAIVGPLFYRRWFSRESMDEPFVKNIVNNIVEKKR